MEKSNIIIRIPEPCHEDWSKMLPDEKGKFCNSCNKSVFDFSNKTDTQIKDILMAHSDQKVCGHFKKTQVDRPLNLTIDLHNLPKNMSVTKMFTIALFISFGTLLFSCTDNLGKTVGEISIAEPPKIENTVDHQETVMVGEIAAIPPDSLEAIQCVEPIENVETVEGQIKMASYTHVAGGISIQHIMLNEPIEPNPIDSPVVSIPEPMEYVVGAMVYYDPKEIVPIEKTDSVKPIETFTVEPTLKEIDINETAYDVIIYPNPNRGEFTIKYEVKKRSDVLVEIVDIKGVTLRKVVDIEGQHTGKYQVPVNISDLTNGVYFVNLTSEGKRITQKVILEK